MIRYLRIVIFLVIGVNVLQAQYNPHDSRLYFNTGAVDVPRNSASFDSLVATNPQCIIDDRFYCIVGFESIPSERLMASMDPWIKLIGYMPNRYFTTSIALVDSRPDLQDLGIVSVYVPTVKDKISPLLTEEVLPWWTITESGMVSVYAHLHHKSLLPFALEQLSRTQFKASAIPSLPIIEVTLATHELEALAQFPFIQYLEPIPHPGENENDQSRTNQRNNYLDKGYNSHLHITGSGVTIMLSDDGDLGYHIDLRNRINQTYVTNTPLTNNHGDHVAGILAGAGNKDPRYRGMAPGANLMVYTYTSNLSATTGLMAFPGAYDDFGVVITSTSQSNGCNTGYTGFAQLLDQQTNDHPHLIHVFSAGNSASINCGYGAGAGWGTITGGSKMAKNVIAVGNVLKNDVLSSSSSKGPGTDGRIKPELVATGTSVMSTSDNPIEHEYASMSGTSMACPGVAGTLAQLYEAYAQQNGGSLPPSALIKAIAMNTADDLGNPGPDFSYGYGRINARRAYNTIAANQFISGAVSHAGTNGHAISVPANVKELRVMLYWHDPAATVNASPSLVNDLDLVLTDPAAFAWDPWVLDPTPNATALNQNAQRNVDHLNNVEQVTIANPAPGTYTATISGFSVPFGPQEYFVVYEFLYDEVVITYPAGGDCFVPGEVERIRWDSYGAAGSFMVEYSLDNGANWTTINSGVSSVLRFYDWVVPSGASGNARVRVSRGSIADISDTTFTILGVPANLQIDTACGSQVTLSWSAVPGATGYMVYQLGTNYMVPVGTTSLLHYKVAGVDISQEQWFSVAAMGADNAMGRRAAAIQLNPTPVNCLLSSDLEVTELLFPFIGNIPDCIPLGAVPVSVKITNNGFNAASGWDIFVSVDGSPTTGESFMGTLLPGHDTNYVFSTAFDISAAGGHNAAVWISLVNDQNQLNDSVACQFNVVTASMISLPYEEDFELMSTCPTTSNCGSVNCTIGNGWTNRINDVEDDLDWRVNVGATPSPLTGPPMDYSPGTTSGKYIYLEASACYEKKSVLLSDCVDLTTATNPHLRFAWSMQGENTGSLVVEVLSGNVWNEIFRREGDHPYDWNLATLDLSAYAGEVVLVKFTGITGNGPYSDIGLDGIIVSELLSGFTLTPDFSICRDSVIVFTDQSVGIVDTYDWDFGSNANPASADTQGPHEVYYSNSGTKTVTLSVTGPQGTNVYTESIIVYRTPLAYFTYTQNGSTLQFYNYSQFGTEFLWNFGDGEFSTDHSPVHTYNNNGVFSVNLYTANPCTWDDSTLFVEVSGIGLTTPNDPLGVQIYPNPAWDNVHISFDNMDDHDLRFELFDFTGKLVESFQPAGIPKKIVTLPVTSLTNGIYLLKISTGDKVGNYRLIISR